MVQQTLRDAVPARRALLLLLTASCLLTLAASSADLNNRLRGKEVRRERKTQCTVCHPQDILPMQKWSWNGDPEPLRAAKGAVVRLSIGDADFLHIGHARVALLSDYVARCCNGTLLVRFESVDGDIPSDRLFAIFHDLAVLGVEVHRTSRATDHRRQLLAACERAIWEGRAYVDESCAPTRNVGTGSSRARRKSVSENLAMWKEMQAGSDKFCVRALLNISSPNPLLQDPVLFYSSAQGQDEDTQQDPLVICRASRAFSVPVLDHTEGVSFVLVSSQPAGRAQQYRAICEVIGRRPPPQILMIDRMAQFGGMPLDSSLLRCLTSCRLTDGRDDTRLPTVGGLLRLGLRIEVLRSFLLLGSGMLADTASPSSDDGRRGEERGSSSPPAHPHQIPGEPAFIHSAVCDKHGGQSLRRARWQADTDPLSARDGSDPSSGQCEGQDSLMWVSVDA
jgi:hypothetical protein